MSCPPVSEDQSFWRELDEKAQTEIRQSMRVRRVARGEMLVEQDAASDAFFIVNFGLFEVNDARSGKGVAEIGRGELIGEIGFFAGAARTASVAALRDSEVLEISRADFVELTKRCPEVHFAVCRALARRLAELAPMTRASASKHPPGPLRIITLIAAGSSGISAEFIDRLSKSIPVKIRSCLLTAEKMFVRLRNEKVDRYAVANWLAEIERSHDLVLCVGDATLTEWTQIALRTADQVFFVADGSSVELNPSEAMALQIFPPSRRRLIILHSRRQGVAEWGLNWQRDRNAFMVHHISLQDEQDVRSLGRFLVGRAVGFVAGGGGAFGPAHIGVFKAFREQGITFDIHGGASVGSAMAAAFSLLMEPDAIQAATDEIFVHKKALKRLTFPRYALLDHEVFDSELQNKFGLELIEDVWKPYFAIATDLSNFSTRVIRSGPLWQAIRASCAIPGVLPPFFDEGGHMLVDGGLADNVPLAVMHSLKLGPNVIVDLRPREHRFFDFAYRDIPGRRALLTHPLKRLLKRGALPGCPDPATVIMRSIFSTIDGKSEQKSASDLLLCPPAFRGSAYMNWERNGEVYRAAFDWGRREIDRLRSLKDPALAAIESAQ